MVTLAKKLTGFFQASRSDHERLEEFRKVYDQNQAYVRRTIYSLVGENNLDDLIQDIFLKIWMARDKFEGRSAIKTWIYRVAINTTYDWLRKHRRERDLQLQPLHEVTEESGSTAEQEAIANKQIIRQTILELPEKQRSAFVLFYQEDFSVSEIAETLEINEGTVKSRLNTARKEFKDLLSQKGVTDYE